MSCESCDLMQQSNATVPHDGLHALHKPKKLRPLGHKPVFVQRFQCRVCGANWMREWRVGTDEHPEWICLHYASSILDPLAALELPPSSPVNPVNQQAGSTVTAGDTEPRESPSQPFWLRPHIG
jgi:hypothetical protein